MFLGQAFTIMLVYVWSRRNPNVRMNFFGLLNFQAPFLPWVLMGFSLLLGNSIIVDLLGTLYLTQFIYILYCTHTHTCTRTHTHTHSWLSEKKGFVISVHQTFLLSFRYPQGLRLVMCTFSWRMCSRTSQAEAGGLGLPHSCEFWSSSPIYCSQI